MDELPTGALTFLHTDIEGSTSLVAQLGERYVEVQRAHQAILRAAWAEHHGVEVDTQGDSFFVVFTRATDALAAAAQAQRALAAHNWPAGAHVQIRMGMHTGAATLSSARQYVGIDVIRAARIAAAGHGGQVLLSQATRDQVAKELVEGQGIRDLGRHRLKGLPRREEIYQLTLPGMPRDFPPLKTLDAWPGYRADLVAVILLSAVLLGLLGFTLPYVVPVFPRVIGLGAAGVAFLILLVAQVRPLRRWLASEWRSARKPAAAVTSALLSLVVVVTTLFITKPPIFLKPAHLGYDFSYVYHTPPHRGGQVTIATGQDALFGLQIVGNAYMGPVINLWQSCIIQLPDTSLGLDGWKPDQCTEVPNIDNGGESLDLRTTRLHIDPYAVWSDGVPITADDFRFADNMTATVGSCPPPEAQRRTLEVTGPDTLVIHWAHQFGDYLTVVERLAPWPLHALATGKFAHVYDPKTGAINVALATQMLAPYFAGQQTFACFGQTNMTFPVVNGAFLVQPQSSVLNTSVTLVRNPRFFSNFFHTPALDRVTLIAANPDGKLDQSQTTNALSADYRNGSADIVEGLTVSDLRQLSGAPAAQVISSPIPDIGLLAFNQRGVAPNARANGGVSIFTDRTVRQVFVEAFDRCGALRAILGTRNCADPNLVTDELTTAASTDYDPSFKLPAYNPTDAARLLTAAGYPVVDNIRRAKDGKTPLRISLSVLDFTAAQVTPFAERMKQDYERSLKIIVNLATNTLAPYGQPGLGSGDFDIEVYADFQDFADPVDVATNSTIIGAPDAQDIPSKDNPYGGNVIGLVDPHIVEKETEGQMAPPGEQSDLLFRNLERYIAGQYDAEPLFIAADVALVKPTICNYKKNPNVVFANEWNIADWYVAPSCP